MNAEAEFDPPNEEGPRVGRRMDDVLADYLRSEGLGDLSRLAVVQSHWSAIVGDELASHSEPWSLRDADLHIRVDQPAWATALKFEAKRVLGELERHLGNSAPKSLKMHVRA